MLKKDLGIVLWRLKQSKFLQPVWLCNRNLSAEHLSITQYSPPVLHSSGSQQYQVFLDEVVSLSQLSVSVLQCQLGPAQQMADLLVLFRAQAPISNTEGPQAFLWRKRSLQTEKSLWRK